MTQLIVVKYDFSTTRTKYIIQKEKETATHKFQPYDLKDYFALALEHKFHHHRRIHMFDVMCAKVKTINPVKDRTTFKLCALN